MLDVSVPVTMEFDDFLLQVKADFGRDVVSSWGWLVVGGAGACGWWG